RQIQSSSIYSGVPLVISPMLLISLPPSTDFCPILAYTAGTYEEENHDQYQRGSAQCRSGAALVAGPLSPGKCRPYGYSHRLRNFTKRRLYRSDGRPCRHVV